MGLMCTLASLLRPIRALWQAFSQPASRGAADASARRTSLNTSAGHGHVAWPQRHHDSRPLRVLRVVDAGHAASTAGRMVISGRMADVCAELDRLAALEGAAA